MDYKFKMKTITFAMAAVFLLAAIVYAHEWMAPG